MPVRVCSQPRCPRIVRDGTRCEEHRKAYETWRGTRQARGYDAAYDRARRRAARVVANGDAVCWRCGEPIAPSDEWHLGHDDHDRAVIRGAEHAHCNLSAAGSRPRLAP